jgi:acetyl-CoA C-acetyltransferase
MENIKDKVAIVGMGCTKFGENWDKSSDDMIIEAVDEAILDAGMERKDIQAAWAGTALSGFTALSLSGPLKLQNIPVTRVENLCCTGTEALRAACYAVASATCDIALAVGWEKLKDTFGMLSVPGWHLAGSGMGTSGIEREVIPGINYALLAVRYFDHYGISHEKGREIMAHIPVKSHRNATLSPKAHFQNEITLEQVLNAPIITWPLGLLDCCGLSDGAAAAIVTRADMARSFRDDPIYIKGIGVSASPRSGRLRQDYDYVHIEENMRVAQTAYQQAGISNPFKELSLAEVHDCFSIHELVIYEDFGWCPRGAAKEYIEGGAFNLDGELPVNTDGGLKCFGHPFGASGLRMMYEVYKQLQGRAGPRQVKNPQLGLTHNLAGGPAESVAAAIIVGR